MADLEAIGDVATGAVLARAVEPRAGGTHEGHRHAQHCLNCRSLLQGEYCQSCG
ncbi:MAG: hypothetical protein H0V46_09225 [Sphingomonas sp.]|nr:hypothetical protein [Sphingomonas sp.]